ncbi:protein FAM217B isoform X1 [Grus americana]|uniref:protein FAM217B isoform X1 n=1 Tax=Grus americana TaxID=9117 RepID=UPI0024084EC5|nr:protein FAM217B isoform X1 [Grus americana]XP_054701903.1 protein FAM217B isoform X1 [Grus americana]XP_054701904.1 protein FAM217B isoform X1 [Grus americana]XP_054701906.1 protein FAM217B isoform X1 [Grus americana]
MGPGIQEYPLLLHRETQKKESQINENHKGMVNYSNGTSHPSTKGLNKPISHVKSSPGRLSKNVSSDIEKTSRDAQESNQPSIFKKGRKQLDDNTQSKRITSVCTSLHRAQGPERSLPERRQNESFLHRIPPSIQGSTQGSFRRVKDVPLQHFYCSKKEQLEENREERVAEAGPCSSKWQEASVDEMFLDFESVQIIKEDAEDDSASDLSDSERIPIPPSPCTPPELILRAEEIDPVCLEHVPDMGFKESEYYYPDFLPPPFNSWDLKQLAISVNVEGKTEFRPKPTGFLEKYIDRLLQLEWLQMQTVQNEKGRAAKARPQTAPSSIRTLKSPGKGKALLGPLPNKQVVPQESVTKLPRSYSGHRGDSYCEESRQLRSHPGHLKLSERMGCALSSQRQFGEVRSELKKKPTAKQQLLNMQPTENSSKIQSVGNVRPPRQTPAFPGSAAPIKGLKTYACTNPKKNGNGNANNCVPSKKPTGDRRIKTNGTKQTSRKFK